MRRAHAEQGADELRADVERYPGGRKISAQCERDQQRDQRESGGERAGPRAKSIRSRSSCCVEPACR